MASGGKLSEWPLIDPDRLPADYLHLGESVDEVQGGLTWHFLFAHDHLLIVGKEWFRPDVTLPGRWVLSQYEYPIECVPWFISIVRRSRLPADDVRALPRGRMMIWGHAQGERLEVTRGSAYGGPHVPGFSLDNLSRYEHSSMGVSEHCQIFEMGDPWLFEGGLLALLESIAQRYGSGGLPGEQPYTNRAEARAPLKY
ncbi:hypothetical protein QQM79_15500 [Marinobacteraceae bacterium S3BR75-40.1]